MLQSVSRSSWIIYLLLTVIWGGAFILIKKSLITFSATEVGLIRVSISFLFLTGFYFLRKPKFSKKDWWNISIVGLLGSTIPVFLFAFAQKQVPSFLAGMINALTPIWSALIAFIIYKQTFKRTSWMGLAIGFFGALVLFYQPDSTIELSFGMLLVVLASLCYSISANIIDKRLKHVKPLDIASGSFMVVGLPALLLSFFCIDWVSLDYQNSEVWFSIFSLIFLAVMATSVGLILFNKLMQQSNIVFTTSITYVLPIVAILFGLLDGEIVSLTQYLGIGIILIAVYLVKK